MSNKLQEIFSDDMFDINGKMRFEDDEAYKNFLFAMELVQNEGRVIPIEGVTSISTEVLDNGNRYPLQDFANISDLVIGPSVDFVDTDIIIDGHKEKIQLKRYQITNGTVVETTKNTAVYFKFLFPNDEDGKHTVTYKVQFKHSKTINDIVYDFKRALAFFNIVYKDEAFLESNEETMSLMKLKNKLNFLLNSFSRLLEVEKVLKMNFEPKYLEDFSEENQRDMEEIYILLCKNDTVKLDSKLTATTSTSLDLPKGSSKLEIGKEIKLTFTGTIEYKLFNNIVILHSSNLLSNAVIKDITEGNEEIKVLYGDSDSKPMYIAYRAFLTEEEAKLESRSILEHEDLYLNAKTINQHIEQYL